MNAVIADPKASFNAFAILANWSGLKWLIHCLSLLCVTSCRFGTRPEMLSLSLMVSWSKLATLCVVTDDVIDSKS